MKEKIISKVSELLPSLIEDIKTVCNIDSRQSNPTDDSPFGEGVKECLNKTLELAKQLGFETENCGNQVGIASFGPETQEYIACVGHLDVVDINGTWKTDPFKCTEIDGTLYARGVLDNKGPILCCLYAMKALKEIGYEFPVKVKIMFGTNEETGMEDMKWYFNNHKYPKMGFTPDCKYPVVYAERGRAQFKISADTYAELAKYLNSYILNQNDLAVSLGLDYSDEEFGKNQVRKVELINEENNYSMSLVCSYPASFKLSEMEERLNRTLSGTLRLELMSNIDPVYFPTDTYLIKSLERAYEAIMEEDGSAVTTTGGTYAKVVKNIVPFGPSFKGQKGIGHLPNEWMRICDIEKNTQIYAYALYELMKGIENA